MVYVVIFYWSEAPEIGQFVQAFYSREEAEKCLERELEDQKQYDENLTGEVREHIII